MIMLRLAASTSAALEGPVRAYWSHLQQPGVCNVLQPARYCERRQLCPLCHSLALEIRSSPQNGHHSTHAIVVVILATQLLAAQLVSGHNLASAVTSLQTYQAGLQLDWVSSRR